MAEFYQPMIPAVKNNIFKIREACKKYSVTSLYLFGSATCEQTRQDSDIDFLVAYQRDKEGLPIKNFDYFDLLFLLEDITGCTVDLVVADAIRNEYFRNRVEQQKQLLYEA
jgi:uncharacterized protein